MRQTFSAFSALLLWFISTLAQADAPIHTGLFSNTAAGGYDVVSYFDGTPPVKGNSRYSAQYQGANWHFSSAANRDAFVANPARYAPQYGGYCAWAVAQGYTAAGDPQHYKLVDGKLYLNYDASVQRKWEADIPGFIRQANSNWPSVLN